MSKNFPSEAQMGLFTEPGAHKEPERASPETDLGESTLPSERFAATRESDEEEQPYCPLCELWGGTCPRHSKRNKK